MKLSILLIRLRSIGDILFTLPAVHAVREAFHDARITFLTFKQNAPLIEGFREVDETIVLDPARYRSGNPIAIVSDTFGLTRRLRAGRFSLAVDFQGYGETAWLTWLSGARQRWGNVYSRGRRWAYTRALTHNSLIHPVDWNLSLLSQCGVGPAKVLNEFALPDPALEEARGVFKAQGLNPAKPTLYIQPLTSFEPKNWPLERHLAVARHWRGRGMQILFGGGAGDRSALEAARLAGFPVAAGNPLLVTAGVMKLSSLSLGGDTGMLHLATAMDKRVLMIMGAVHTGHAYPFQHPDWAITPSAGKPVSSIATEAVIEASARAFAESGLNTAAHPEPN